MRLLIVGQHLKNVLPTSISQSLLRALQRKHVEVEIYDLSLYFPKYYQFVLRKLSFLQRQHLSSINRELISYIRDREFTHILVTKGTYLLAQTVAEIKRTFPSIVISCFNADDPFNQQKGSSHAEILNAIKFYDHYFIWARRLMPKLEKAGVPQVHFLPFAADPEIIYPLESIEEKYDVSFIGNADQERFHWIKSLAMEMKGAQGIHVFGYDWQTLQGVEMHPPVLGAPYLEALAASKININILRLQNKNAINMRTFEIPASGKFMLHEVSEEASDMFIEGKEAEYFRSAEELADKCRYYLKHDSLRNQIAQAGYEKILKAGYTYDNRIDDLLAHLHISGKETTV